MTSEERDEVAGMIAQVADNSDQLNDWEREFIESISEQFDNRGSLSPKQKEILEKLYGKLK